jgi:hypothetical protein
VRAGEEFHEARIVARVGGCQSNITPTCTNIVGRLIRSRLLASPSGLPVHVALLPLAPFCEPRKHSGLTQTPYSFQLLRSQDSVPYFCCANSRARWKISALNSNLLQLCDRACANFWARSVFMGTP